MRSEIDPYRIECWACRVDARAFVGANTRGGGPVSTRYKMTCARWFAPNPAASIYGPGRRESGREMQRYPYGWGVVMRFRGAGSPLWNNGIKKYMRRVLRAKNKQSLPSSGIGRPRRRRHAGFTTAHMSEIAILGITSAIRIFEVRRLRVHPFSSGWAPGGAAGIPGEAVICAMALRYLHHALLILRILPNAISSPHPYGVFPDGGVLHNANIYQILRRRFGLDGVSGLRTAPFCVRKKCAIWRLSRFGICALPYIVSTQWRPGR